MKVWPLLIILVTIPASYAVEDDSYTYLNGEGSDFEEEEFEGFYGDSDFVSISTGSKKALPRVPSVASVITADQIKSLGARTLEEVLETIPGLHVSRSSQLLAPKMIFRGITTKFNPQTLVLVNGIPISSVVRGDRHIVWGEFPIHSISRIEIIRGPGSATHGADAYAGVINVITKDFDDITKTEIGGSWGSFDTNEVWGVTATQIGEVKMSFTAEYTTSDGYDGQIDWDAQTNFDLLGADLGLNVPFVSLAPGNLNASYRGLDVRFDLGYENFNLNVGYQNRANVGTGQGVGNSLDQNGRFGSDKLLISLDYKKDLRKDWKLDVNYSYYRSDQRVEENLDLYPNGSFFGAFPDGLSGNPGWSEQSMMFQPRLTYYGNDRHVIAIGGGYREEDLFEVVETKNFDENLNYLGQLIDVSDTPDVYMPEANRNSYFVFVQDEYQLAPDWEATFGIRYDDYSDFGSTTNPRLALVWATNRNFSTKFLYGRAFRKPSFAELNVVNNPVAQGNPNLKPETIDTFEIAFNYQISQNFHLDFNVYQFSASKLINFVPDSNALTSTAQNSGNIDGYGLELEFNYKISSDFTLTGNYAYQNAQDKEADDDLGGTPNHQVYGRLTWQINDWIKLNTNINYFGKIERNSVDPRKPIKSNTSVGLSLIFENIYDGYGLVLKGTNIFDSDYKEPSDGPSTANAGIDIPYDIPQIGRAFYVIIRKSF